MTAEEFFKHRGWSGTQHLYKDAEDYGKLQYNQALEDAANNANVIYTQKEFGMEISFAEVNKEPLLKLKK